MEKLNGSFWCAIFRLTRSMQKLANFLLYFYFTFHCALLRLLGSSSLILSAGLVATPTTSVQHTVGSTTTGLAQLRFNSLSDSVTCCWRPQPQSCCHLLQSVPLWHVCLRMQCACGPIFSWGICKHTHTLPSLLSSDYSIQIFNIMRYIYFLILLVHDLSVFVVSFSFLFFCLNCLQTSLQGEVACSTIR